MSATNVQDQWVRPTPEEDEPELPSEKRVRSWNYRELYIWLTSLQPPPLSPDAYITDRFKKLQIDGQIFLKGTFGFFVQECQLPVGVAKRLCLLSETIILPGPTVIESPKKRGHSSGSEKRLSLTGIASRSEPRLALMEKASNLHYEAVNDLDDQIRKLDISCAKLSDPKNMLLLPFPFLGPAPHRFQLDNKNHFKFTGRSMFSTVYDMTKQMNTKQQKRVHIHGTLGVGKSYLLAALVSLLLKEGVRVVYVPDCYELCMSEPPVSYLISSLATSFCKDAELGPEIRTLADTVLDETSTSTRLEWEVLVFCNLAAKLQKNILFVVDQANTLDDSQDDRVSNKKKMEVRRLLDGLSSYHMKISSSTATYAAAKHDEFRATSEGRINLNMGMDDAEIAAWWEGYDAQNTESLSPSDKQALERLTGRMPIHLRAVERLTKERRNSLMGKGKTIQIGPIPVAGETSYHSEPSEAVAHSENLVADLSSRMMHTAETVQMINGINKFFSAKVSDLIASDDTQGLQSFRLAWKGCIIEEPVDEHDCAHLDGRYFFLDKNGIGRSSCNIARMVGATRLREIENLAEFAEKPWKKRIADCSDNPAVLGFQIERAVLGLLIKQGTIYAGGEFSEAHTLDKFTGRFPIYPPKRKTPTIYVPTTYSYEGVDAILALRPPASGKRKRDESAPAKKAIVVGVQVTIANQHSDSESMFLNSWRAWEELMGSDTIEFRFLWVLENTERKSTEWEEVSKKTRMVRSREYLVHPGYTRRYISFMTFDNDLGNSVRAARESLDQ